MTMWGWGRAERAKISKTIFDVLLPCLSSSDLQRSQHEISFLCHKKCASFIKEEKKQKKETKHSFFMDLGSLWCELWTYVAAIIHDIDDG